jgi:hypothetical protein
VASRCGVCGGGLVRFQSGQGKFGDMPPSSLEGPAFHCVLVKLAAQLSLSVSFAWVGERVDVRLQGECLRADQYGDSKAKLNFWC